MGSFEKWCWERISWTDRVRNVKYYKEPKRRGISCELNRRKVDWIGHILRRNCLLKYAGDGKIEGRI